MKHMWISNCNCNTLQHTATHCNTHETHVNKSSGQIATRYNSGGESLVTRLSANKLQLQYTATHCNTLQHTATHCNRRDGGWEPRHMMHSYVSHEALSHHLVDLLPSRRFRRGSQRPIQCVMSRIWMSHIPQMNESRDTYDWVMHTYE